MEILQLDADNLSESFNKNRQHYQETSRSSSDFEEITSFDGSVDSGRIKSFKLSPHCSDELTQTIRPSRREETYMEKIHDIGTNLKYNFELLSQSLWMKDEPDKTKVYMLGKEYSVSHTHNRESNEQDQTVEKAFSELIWFTYRKNFPKLNYREISSAESYVSDTGWGCMIRACQMMLGESLRKILNEDSSEESNKESGKKNYSQNKLDRRTSRPSRNDEKQREKRNIKKVLSWFLDCETNPASAPYSIQNICSALYKRFNLKPGNWFKASSVLFSLQTIHETYANYTQPNIKMEVFPEGTIYISQALKKVTSPNVNTNASLLDFEKGFEVIEEEEDDVCFTSSLNLPDNSDSKYTDQEGINKSIVENRDNVSADIENLMKLKWHSSLLLTVMAKTGLDKPNPEYIPFIKELISYPEFIGMIGGKPGLASYVVGYMEDKLMVLDPHFVHESVQNKKDLKEHLHTYHCSSIKYVGFNEIDTSVAFGFLIRNENEFRDFIRRFKASCEKKESFLAVVEHPPQEDVLEVETFDEEGEFEMISLKCRFYSFFASF